VSDDRRSLLTLYLLRESTEQGRTAVCPATTVTLTIGTSNDGSEPRTVYMHQRSIGYIVLYCFMLLVQNHLNKFLQLFFSASRCFIFNVFIFMTVNHAADRC